MFLILDAYVKECAIKERIDPAYIQNFLVERVEGFEFTIRYGGAIAGISQAMTTQYSTCTFQKTTFLGMLTEHKKECTGFPVNTETIKDLLKQRVKWVAQAVPENMKTQEIIEIDPVNPSPEEITAMLKAQYNVPLYCPTKEDKNVSRSTTLPERERPHKPIFGPTPRTIDLQT